jgi:teichuronic acid biosynthesis glycosyltransferase TuaC
VRILVLTKRQYMGKDLLDDAYGRFYELPLELARLGHEVRGVCASYRPRDEGVFNRGSGSAEVSWHAVNVRPLAPWTLYRWTQAIDRQIRSFAPQVVWACSDSFHAIVGVGFQTRRGVPCVVDLYDNFESYLGTALPGVRPWFRSRVRRAAGVTCVSRPLERLVRGTYGVQGRTMVLENGVSAEFRPLDRLACRARFRLPRAAKVIGTAGALDAERGIETLVQAFLQLAAKRPDLYLLLAGRVGADTPIPVHPRVVHLGQLPLAEVPYVIGAMDVSVICNKRSAFGEYCFPQKLYEVIACAVAPLVANTAGVAELLEGTPRNRYEPESVDSLVQGIEGLLSAPAMPPISPVSWKQHGARLSDFLTTTVTPAAKGRGHPPQHLRAAQ